MAILVLYPLRHIAWGLDLWDTGYGYANFEYMDMSETHFRRLFESYINMPPMEYLNLIRVQKAVRAMKKTN